MAVILVVDDETGIRELLSEILEDEGHTVELAANAAQARAVRQRITPGLVLLDIWMPDTDGVTLLKEWMQGGLLTMPVIMMSGHGTIDHAVEATRIGAIAFLEKPITMSKLLKAVGDALSRGLPSVAAAPALRQAEQAGGAAFGAPPSSMAADAARALPAAAGAARAGELPAHAVAAVGRRGDDGAAVVDHAGTVLELDLPLREARDAFERAYFEFHLARENGSMTRVAEKTGLERTHLYRKLKQLGVDIPRAGSRRQLPAPVLPPQAGPITTGAEDAVALPAAPLDGEAARDAQAGNPTP
jgi:DNA-binding NtrC family response regulator